MSYLSFTYESYMGHVSEKLHRQMTLSSANGQYFPYFRFFVQEGLATIALDEWKTSKRHPNESTISKIERAAKGYPAHEDVVGRLRELALTLIHQRCLKFSSRLAKSIEMEGKGIFSKAISSPPFQRTAKFAARQNILRQIEEKVSPGSRLALSGLGGIG